MAAIYFYETPGSFRNIRCYNSESDFPNIITLYVSLRKRNWYMTSRRYDWLMFIKFLDLPHQTSACKWPTIWPIDNVRHALHGKHSFFEMSELLDSLSCSVWALPKMEGWCRGAPPPTAPQKIGSTLRKYYRRDQYMYTGNEEYITSETLSLVQHRSILTSWYDLGFVLARLLRGLLFACGHWTMAMRQPQNLMLTSFTGICQHIAIFIKTRQQWRTPLGDLHRPLLTSHLLFFGEKMKHPSHALSTFPSQRNYIISLGPLDKFPWNFILEGPPLWSSDQEFLATDPEVPSSIPGHYKKEKNSGSGTQPREYNWGATWKK
jgi:hypothetical protein